MVNALGLKNYSFMNLFEYLLNSLPVCTYAVFVVTVIGFKGQSTLSGLWGPSQVTL